MTFPDIDGLKSIVFDKVVAILAGLLLIFITTVVWNKLYARVLTKIGKVCTH